MRTPNRNPFKLAISGTPLENSLLDLWALLSITAPGLFPHEGKFIDYYRRPSNAMVTRPDSASSSGGSVR